MYAVFSGEQHIIGNDLAKLEPMILFRFFSRDPLTADEFIDKA